MQSGIANDQEAQHKAKNILQNFKELKSYTGRWGVNAWGEYILIFKLKPPKPTLGGKGEKPEKPKVT